MLHGAGGRPSRSIELLRPLADREGFALLAPRSRGTTWDRVLPQLRREGYDVTSREFEGGHEIPLDVREAATRWFTGQR